MRAAIKLALAQAPTSAKDGPSEVSRRTDLDLGRRVTREVLDKGTWIGDTASKTCTGCGAAFTVTRRRHHCRVCGGLYCGACCGTSHKISLENAETGKSTKQRVCLSCLEGLAMQRQSTYFKDSREYTIFGDDNMCHIRTDRQFAVASPDGVLVTPHEECAGHATSCDMLWLPQHQVLEVRGIQADPLGVLTAVTEHGSVEMTAAAGENLKELFRTKVDAFGKPAWQENEVALAQDPTTSLTIGDGKALGKGVSTLTSRRLIWFSSAPNGLVDGDAVSFSLRRVLDVTTALKRSNGKRLCITLTPGQACGVFYGNQRARAELFVEFDTAARCDAFLFLLKESADMFARRWSTDVSLAFPARTQALQLCLKTMQRGDPRVQKFISKFHNYAKAEKKRQDRQRADTGVLREFLANERAFWVGEWIDIRSAANEDSLESALDLVSLVWQKLGYTQPPTAEDLARLLRNHAGQSGISKASIGAFLGRGEEFNNTIRRAYVRLFSFESLSLSSALRCFLVAFQLPRESPMIERIFNDFAAQFYCANPAHWIQVRQNA